MQYYYCQRYCTIQKMSTTSLLLVHLLTILVPIYCTKKKHILTKKLSFQIADYVYETNYYFFFEISGAKISSNGQ